MSIMDWWSSDWSISNILHLNDDPLGLIDNHYRPWFCSITASITIGLAGILPLVFIPNDFQKQRNDEGK